MASLTPPIKCQGIKTKLIPDLQKIYQASQTATGNWIEPFSGSSVVALNLRPQAAVLSDTNKHIISFYRSLQKGHINSITVRSHLEMEDKRLRIGGQEYYNEVRERFNSTGNSLDFLFLNRSCFNGVMRFNSKGRFNVPFCHKPERFSAAYITKIVNQVRSVQDVLRTHNWLFEVDDFRTSLCAAKEQDFVYVDPPYFGRHADYFNAWNVDDEDDLINWLKNAPCKWAFSTWHSNEFRKNETALYWESLGYWCHKIEHFYHVGASEDLRHPMVEAIFTNFDPKLVLLNESKTENLSLFS